MKVEEVLQNCGLSKNEAKIYLALLQLGSSKAGKISKLAQIDRTSTYNSLKLLIEKGLASYVIVGKVRWFQPASPEKLLILTDEKREGLMKVMPFLNAEYKEKKLEENVRLFKGLRGIRTVLEDILNEGKPNLVFGSEGQLEKNMPAFAQRFVHMLKKRKIKVKSLVREGRRDVSSKTAEVRFVPKTVKSNVVTNIYGNKIAIVIWSKTPEAILIENKTAAEAYRSYFWFMWERAKRKHAH
ncbi:MAG: helix-turn-helix domain-containing protein [Candidatus Anstonellales archaeon]